MSRESVYTIPYSRIPVGSKVILYGAGKMGKNYYQNIKKLNRLNLVAILDRNAATLFKVWSDVSILEPKAIVNLNYDYILITIEDETIANIVKNDLHQYGVSEKKIIWLGEELDVKKESAIEAHKFVMRAFSNFKQRFYIFMLPEHGNTGDYAIGYAEQKFLNHYFNQYDLYGITSVEWLKAKDFLINIINENDVIFINGGGFFGDLRGDDATYKDIVDKFPNNKKIFFPNNLTYKYEPTSDNVALMEDIQWIKKQRDLHIFLRERKSFNLLKKYINNCYLAPDMAFLLNFPNLYTERNGKVLCCLRDDCEKKFTKEKILEEQLLKGGLRYDKFDIYTKTYFSQELGMDLLEYVINKFQKYDCIITDRLHGMILAVIANIPCIAIDNTTGKISGVYEWIQNKGYAQMIEESDLDNLVEIIHKVCDKKISAGEYRPQMEWFDAMAIKINEILNV